MLHARAQLRRAIDACCRFAMPLLRYARLRSQFHAAYVIMPPLPPRFATPIRHDICADVYYARYARAR